MTNQSHVTAIRPRNRALAIVLMLGAAIAPALAHGGFRHIRGTVASAANGVLTVKTDKGDVAVKIDANTDLSRNGQKVQASDLKPGARVIVEVPEESKDNTAKSVRIGAGVGQTGGR